MNRSEQINELAAALCKAQSAMGAAKKDAQNPFFKSTYADLGSVVEAVKGPLTANGLAYTQLAGGGMDGMVTVETVLMHASGQWISETLHMRPVKADPQALGSAITYARRYGLQSLCGIPAEDDDGNAASAVKPPVAAHAAKPAPRTPGDPRRAPETAPEPEAPAGPAAPMTQKEKDFISQSEALAKAYSESLEKVATLADLNLIAASIKEDSGVLTKGDADVLRMVYTARLAKLKPARAAAAKK